MALVWEPHPRQAVLDGTWPWVLYVKLGTLSNNQALVCVLTCERNESYSKQLLRGMPIFSMQSIRYSLFILVKCRVHLAVRPAAHL